MKIGKISLCHHPLFLAPMEDVTDRSFRLLCKEFGADIMYTEFISSDALIRNAQKSIDKLVIELTERPVGVQIYGNDVEAMVLSAQIAERSGADLVDINFGCPVKKIAGRGAGSGMMKNVALMEQITREVVKSVNCPVTVKTRLGWDDNSKNIEDISERLQDVGIDALTIHGRTRSQMYKGEADWHLIGSVKNNPRIHIPIIGNGDVNSCECAKEMFDRWGVDGVMIGRATYGYPWIFSDCKSYFSTGIVPSLMNVTERVAIAKRHLELSVKYKGERVGVLELRRHLSCYFKGLPDFKSTRIRLVTAPTFQEVFFILEEIAHNWAEYEYLERPTTLYGL